MKNNTDSDNVHIPQKCVVACDDSLKVRREKIKNIIEQVVNLWKEGDCETLQSLFSASGTYMSNKDVFKGDNIEKELKKQRESFCELYVKRMVIDAEQLMGSMEAVTRSKTPSAKGYEEKQIAWVLALAPSGDQFKISNWHVWTDPVWNVHLNSLETPLPPEVWKPAPPSSTPLSREKVCDLIVQKIKSYTRENVHEWSNCVHEDIVMHPPWDMLIGRDTSKKGLHVFFENYSNTQITPLLLLFDEAQPNFVVYQQIFKTKNKNTGEEGEDLDFVFIEVADEKIRYWRTYFNTTSSAQKGDSTFRQVFAKTMSNRSLSSSSSSPSSSSPLSSSPSSSSSPLSSSPSSDSPLSSSPLSESKPSLSTSPSPLQVGEPTS